MKKLNFILIIVVFFTNIVSAQTPNIEWQKCFGSPGYDYAFDICNSADSNFVVIGSAFADDSLAFDGFEGNGQQLSFWVVKFDNSGDTIWTKKLGGSSNDMAWSVQMTNNYGYILAGGVWSNDGDIHENYGCSDYWVVKLNSAGDTTWTKNFGGMACEEPKSVIQTTDGGYIVSGSTNTPNVSDIWGNHIDSSTYANDFWVLKLNNLGDTLWTRCYGGNYNEYAESIIQTSEGGYLICGNATSLDGDVSGNHGQIDDWVVKTDSMGDIEWEKSYGGSQNDFATSAIQVNDSMFVITGYTSSNDGDVHGNHGNADFWVLKINNLGDTIWTKTFGGLGDDIANSIVQTDDGQYVILGSTTSDNGICFSNHGQNDYLLIKIDSNGQLVWRKCLGGTKNDFGESVKISYDGEYVLTGYSQSTDGDVTGLSGGYDYWVVKLSESANNEAFNNVEKIIKIFPNPIEDVLNIVFYSESICRTKVSVKDITGRLISEFDINTQKGKNMYCWHPKIELSKGVYLLTLTQNGNTKTLRFVK